jgi:hypothetical protein
MNKWLKRPGVFVLGLFAMAVLLGLLMDDILRPFKARTAAAIANSYRRAAAVGTVPPAAEDPKAVQAIATDAGSPFYGVRVIGPDGSTYWFSLKAAPSAPDGTKEWSFRFRSGKDANANPITNISHLTKEAR